MSTPYKGFLGLERWMNSLGAAGLLVIMLLVTCNVISRYVFHYPFSGTLEIIELIMVVVVYTGLAHTQFLKAHINIDLVLTRISEKNQLICEVISMAFAVVLFSLIAWQGSLAFIEAYEIHEVTEGSLEAPLWPAKLALPFGCLILCIRYLIDIVHNVKKLTGEKK